MGKMRYYKITDPYYYMLLKAKSKKSALRMYTNATAESAKHVKICKLSEREAKAECYRITKSLQSAFDSSEEQILLTDFID